MGFWIDIMTNRLFISCVLTVLIVQLAKIIINSIKNRKCDCSSFWQPGGMPSSHTAAVVAMTSGITFEQGVSTLAVAAGMLSVIVIYDAMTLRRTVGYQSAILNKLAKKSDMTAKLKERVGHKFIEVLVGGMAGFVITYAVFHL